MYTILPLTLKSENVSIEFLNLKSGIYYLSRGINQLKKSKTEFHIPEFNNEIEDLEEAPEFKMPTDTANWKPKKETKTPQLDKLESALMDNLKLAKAGTEYIRETIIQERRDAGFKNVKLPVYKQKLDSDDLKQFLEMVNANGRALSQIATTIVSVERTRNQLAPDPNHPTKVFDVDTFLKTGDMKFVKETSGNKPKTKN